MKNHFLIFLISCYWTFFLSYHAQAQKNQDTTIIRAQLNEAEALMDAYKAEEALHILEPIVKQFQRQEHPPVNLYFDLMKDYVRNLYLVDKYAEATSASEKLVQIAGQISPADPVRRAYAWSNYALYASSSQHFETATEAVKKAKQLIAQYQLQQHWVNGYYFYCEQLVFYRKGEFDQCIASANEGIAWYRMWGDTTSREFSGLFKSVGVTHLIKGEYEKGLKNTLKAIELVEQFNGKDHPLALNQYNNLGIYYKQKGDYKKALDCYRQVVKIAKKAYGEKNDYLAGTYNNMGLIYNKQGDYYRAVNYLELSENIDKALQGENYDGLTFTYTNLGSVYSNLQQYPKAIKYLTEALRIKRLLYGESHPLIGQTYSTIASIYIAMGDFGPALEHQKKAIAVRTRSFSPTHVRLTYDYHQLASIHQQLKQYGQAIAYYEKSNRILKENLAGKHDFFAANHLQLARILAQLNNFKSAFEHLELAFNYLNYDPETQRMSEVNSLPRLQNVLEEVARLHFKKYFLSGRLEDLESAHRYSKNSLEVFQSLRRSVREDASRTILADRKFSIFENALNICFELYRKTNRFSYMEDAFEVMEYSKSFNLLSALRNTEAADFAGLPQKLQEEEKELRLKLKSLQNEKANLFDSKEFEEQVLNRLNENIFQTNILYNELLNRIEEDYPDYYRIKYSSQSISIADLQTDILKEGEVFLEYVLGDSSIYTISIGKRRCIFSRKALPLSFLDLVNDFRNGLQTGNYRDNDVLHLSVQFQELLFGKQLASFGKEVNRLIIVPDGILGYLPFEALSLNNNANELLIQRYTVSYAYSAALLREQLKSPNRAAKHLFGGFAADYSTFQLPEEKKAPGTPIATLVRGDLLPLPNAKKEVTAIAELLDGHSFTDAQASEKIFKESAGDYQIIHLSLHTLFNDLAPLQSDLIFTPSQDSLEDGYLTTAELYNIPLNAQLAVLSACNTGVGKIHRGEGIMSLSRALSHVGVPAVIMSLWKVPDHATAKIMIAFYRHLQTGLPKDEALRKAKLDYLDSVVEPDERRPFYWAGFVAVGNMEPINFPQKGRLWRVLGSVLSLALGILLFRRLKLAS